MSKVRIIQMSLETEKMHTAEAVELTETIVSCPEKVRISQIEPNKSQEAEQSEI